MITPATTRTLYQFIRLPFLGEAWVERETDRPSGVPYFYGEASQLDGKTGPLSSITVRAGRWVAIADRPVSRAADSDAHPLVTAAWIALGAPLMALVAVGACLLARAVRCALTAVQVR